MTIVLDLDGVICENTRPYSKAIPIEGARLSMVLLKEAGHRLVIHTARHLSDRALTLAWLRDYDIPFDRLIMGKPKGDLYLDDKGFRFTSWEEVEL